MIITGDGVGQDSRELPTGVTAGKKAGQKPGARAIFNGVIGNKFRGISDFSSTVTNPFLPS
jgi:hypothetical protein